MVLIITIIFLLIKDKLRKEETTDIITYDEIIKNDNDKEEETIICAIDIKGAINSPGVYTTECNKYVFDIIKLAGGLTDNADTSNINLAKKITDEMVIIINTEEEIKNNKTCNCKTQSNNNIESTKNIINNQLININTATLEELKTLPGIGDTKAKAIIDYRINKGLFKSIDEIINVTGIGENLYEQIKIYLTT